MKSTSVVTAIVVSSSQIDLSWTPIDAPMGYSVSSYSIFRNTVSIGSVPGTQTTYQDKTGLTASTTYSYYVRAVMSENSATSASSNTVSAVTQAPPVPVWNNAAFAVQNGTFTATFDVTPAAASGGIAAVIGLSVGSANAYTGLAAIVRFSNESNGSIDVRRGSVYGYDLPVIYSASVSYKVRMDVNVPARTYSVYVTPAGGSEVAMAKDFAFRSEQSTVASLANFCSYCELGGVTVTPVVISNSVPAIQPPVVVGTAGLAPSPAPHPTGGLITSFTMTPNQLFDVDGHSYGVDTAGKPYSVTNPDSKTLRFEVRTGENWPPYDSSSVNRSELDGYPLMIAANKIINLAYKIQLEAGSPNTAPWFVIGQLHSDDKNRAAVRGGPILWTSPPIAVELLGEKLSLVMRYCPSNLDPTNGAGNLTLTRLWTDTQNIVRGDWYNIQLQVYSMNDSTGYVRLWRNGTQVVNYNGPVGYGYGNYWCYGLYRAATTTTIACKYQNMTLTLA